MADPVSDGADERRFPPEYRLGDLGRHSVRGASMTLAAQGIKFLLQLVATVVLARLLTPGDFGLVGMVAAFTGFASLVGDLGLSHATVQRERISHDQLSTLFWINVAVSVAFMLVAIIMAPAVAWFYGEPRLTLITIATGATFVLGGISAQHFALLRRQMRFAPLSAIEVAAAVGGIVAGITAALADLNYWALVIMSAARAAVGSALAWRLSGWVPGPPRRQADVRSLLSFGAGLTGFNMFNYMGRNADNMLIGWYWGSTALGLYGRAYGLMTLPLYQIRPAISGVVVPVLCRLKNRDTYRDYYSHATKAFALLIMPPLTVAIVAGDWLVSVLLGTQWLECIPILRWLAIAGIVQVALGGTGWLFVSQGRTTDMFRWGVVSSLCMVTAFVVGLPSGPVGVAAAYSIITVALAPVSLYLATRGGTVSWVGVLRPITPAILVSMALFAGLGVLRTWWNVSDPIQGLVVSVSVLLGTMIGIVYRIYRVSWAPSGGA